LQKLTYLVVLCLLCPLIVLAGLAMSPQLNAGSLESVDLDGAYHTQNILAYEMNDLALPIAHGAPLRLRDER